MGRRKSKNKRNTSSGKSAPWMEGVGYLMVAFVGLMMIFKTGSGVVDGMASRTWPKTSGNVTQSHVVTEWVRRRKSGSKRVYRHQFEFTYRVDNENYVGSRVEFLEGNTFSYQSDAHSQQKKYPVGSRVEVFYSPDDPTLCVLRPGFHISSVLVIFMGLVIVCGVSVFAVKRRRHWWRSSDQ